MVQVVRDPLPDGSWKNLIYNPLTRGQIAQLPSAEDREILSLMSCHQPLRMGLFGGTRPDSRIVYISFDFGGKARGDSCAHRPLLRVTRPAAQ